MHRQIKDLSNVVDGDHGKLKQLVKPVRGFKTLKAAYATIKGLWGYAHLAQGQAAISTVSAMSVERLASLKALSLSDRAP